MDLLAKIRTIPIEPGVYLYKNAEGEVIYVGKAKNLRSRVASYFHEGRWEDSKTGTLVREAVDVDYIVVANNKRRSRSKTISSSSASRASTSCCATTRLTLT